MTETIRVDHTGLERPGQTVPTEVTIDVARRVTEARGDGARFSDVARLVPETLSPSGAHAVYIAALRHFTSVISRNRRHPFDGKTHAPAWTPARSPLATKLRATDRP